MLDGSTEAIPIGQRNAIQGARIGFTEIKEYDAEAARMEEQVGSANSVFGISVGTNPHQFFQTNSGRGGTNRGETIEEVNHGTHFALSGCLRQNLQAERQAAGRAWTIDFGDAAARETFGENLY